MNTAGNVWGAAPRSLDTVEDCIHLATVAHRGQKDKAGEPYILHPLRVMLTFTTNMERAVAVLHDVIEDTPVTLDDLNTLGLDPIALDAVEALWKRPATPDATGERYFDYIERVMRNDLARRVKIADVEDNLARLSLLPPQDAGNLAARYTRALAILKGGSEHGKG